jgi:hypothetical protein
MSLGSGKVFRVRSSCDKNSNNHQLFKSMNTNVFAFLVLFTYLEKVSLCIPGWPGSHSVAYA